MTQKEQRESIIAMFRESAPGLELERYEFEDLEQKDHDLIAVFNGISTGC